MVSVGYNSCNFLLMLLLPFFPLHSLACFVTTPHWRACVSWSTLATDENLFLVNMCVIVFKLQHFCWRCVCVWLCFFLRLYSCQFPILNAAEINYLCFPFSVFVNRNEQLLEGFHLIFKCCLG